MVKVSIIVPIYKVEEHYLRKCIESIINQTMKNIEIILVDDESPDDCGKICDNYAKIDNRIKVIHQKNKGLSGARNSGVSVATGEYITFVDGDDWIEKQMCETLYNYASDEKYDIICASIVKDYNNNLYKYKYTKFVDKKLYRNDECKYWQKEVLDHNANISGVYAKLIKRDIIVKNNIYHNEQLKQGAEGIEFNLRLFEKVNTIFFTEEYFYHYMYNPNSISASHNEENHNYVLQCFEKIKLYIKTLENNDELMKMFYTRMIYVIITTAISGYFNPDNKEKYKTKCEKYEKYLSKLDLKEILENADMKQIDIERKIIIFLIKNKLFFCINLLAIIRKKSKVKKLNK